jgi:formylglycine-generating enzyme required for sulfatase activity
MIAIALLMASLLASAGVPDRVPVPGGRYRAGSSRDLQRKAQSLCASTASNPEFCGPGFLEHEDRRTRRVLEDFLIDRFEASQGLYRQCVAAGACRTPGWPTCRYGNGSSPAAREREVLEKEDHPVVCVTFEQARAFCRWRHGDLPDEAQWEKAAGGARLFPWGDTWNPAQLNWGEGGTEDGFTLTAPVGSFPGGASPYGAEGMVGNVWEWAIRLEALDEDDASGQQAIRGGGFAAPPHAQRIHKRAPYDPARGYPNVGFRCVYPP